MAKFHGSNSFLRNAGAMDVFLDVNNLPKMPKGLYDEDYKIKADVDGRPDILAYKVYGTTELWWVFALRNLISVVKVLLDAITKNSCDLVL